MIPATTPTLSSDNAPCTENGTSAVVVPCVKTAVHPRSGACSRRPSTRTTVAAATIGAGR